MGFQYKATRLSEDTFRLDEQIGDLHTYAYLLIGTKKALLIDSGAGFGNIYAAVQELTDKPITVVNTHGHTDHIGGNANFNEAFLAKEDFAVSKEHQSSAYRKALIEQLQKERNFKITDSELIEIIELKNQPKFTEMQDGDIFDIGERILEVVASLGHTPGSVCLLERARKTLYTGDTICAQGILLSLPHSSSVEEYLVTVKKLQKMASLFDTIHPGHHEAPLGIELINKYISCAEKIINNTAKISEAQAVGEACLFSQYEDIGISYLHNRIFKQGEL